MSNFISRKLFLCATIGASFVSLISSCQDEDFGYTSDVIAYRKSFNSTFGKIPADKSWDLSSYTNIYDPEASSSLTRATKSWDGNNYDLPEGAFSKDFDYWEVPKQTLLWMQSALIESKDNRYLGSNFVLQLPENDFVIIPIYQGKSAINSALEIKINGYKNTEIWTRCENFLVSGKNLNQTQLDALPYPLNPSTDITNSLEDGETPKWHTIGYYDGFETLNGNPVNADEVTEGKDSQGNPVVAHDGLYYNYVRKMCPSYTDESARVLTKPIYFDVSTLDKVDKGFMYLSLHNNDKMWDQYSGYQNKWDSGNTTTTIGDRLTSINPDNHMLALALPMDSRPANLPDIANNRVKPSQVLMIACEDANGVKSDHDINDVVFLIVGYPNAPTVIPTTEVIEKRYMCEDLGGTLDYDFNDIVVDVRQTRKFKIKANPETISDPTVTNIHIEDMVEDGEPVQQAMIAHVCGTLPIQARVGNYIFPKISDPTDKGRTREELKGSGTYATAWDPNTRAEHTNANPVEHPSGWNPNETKVITDNSWKPNENNVRIYVEWKDSPDGDLDKKNLDYMPEADDNQFADFSNGRFKTVTFPKDGAYPYIIAVDPTVTWMPETVHIPEAWITGDLSDLRPTANPGSCLYMEDYPAPDGEGRIWTGRVTGLAKTTGVKMLVGSPEHEAIKECVEGGRNYMMLKVYTEPLPGEVGSIGLCKGDWTKLSATGPDGYLQGYSDNHSVTGQHTDGLVCTTIYLTQEEYNTIKSSGLIVTSQTNGLVIRKISMQRPCEYDGSTVKRDGNSAPVLDPGFTIKFVDYPYANGSIRAEDRESDGKIPYISAKYTTGTSRQLTAVPAAGHKLKNWIINGVEKGSKPNPMTFTHNEYSDFTFTVKAVFEEANNPQIAFDKVNGSKKTINITLLNTGGSYNLPIYSLNMSDDCLMGTNGGNTTVVTMSSSKNGTSNHVVTLTPQGVGETSFVIYQPDGDYNEVGYGVSEELTVNVKVVSSLPEVTATLEETKDHTDFYDWSSGDRNAHIISTTWPNNIEKRFNNSVTTNGENKIFGNKWGNYAVYTDLPNANTMVVEVAEGDIEVVFNKQLGEGEWAVYNGARTTIDDTSDECMVVYNPTSGGKLYVIDLNALRQKDGYVHLNTVSAPDGKAATVTSIKFDNVQSDIRVKWNELNNKRSTAETVLSVDDIYQWDRIDGNAVIVGRLSSEYVSRTGTDYTENGYVLFGHSSAAPYHYVDLSSANYLVVKASTSTENLYFQFNRNTNWTEGKNIQETNKEFCAVVKLTDDYYEYVVDLQAIRSSLGIDYLHLNGIGCGWNGKIANISEIRVDDKESRNVNNYLRVQAVTTWEDLGIDKFKEYTDLSGQDVSSSSSFGEEYHVGESAGNVYGHGSVLKDCYALLDGYTILKLVVEEGEPRILFNRSSDANDFIEITPSNNKDWIYKNGNIYYIMMWPIQEVMKQNIRLNAIKGANYQNVKVTSLQIGKP